MNIGTIIKKLRIKQNLTQEELSKKLNVSTQAVSKWENGGAPDIELIPEIAKLFNVTIDELFDYQKNYFNEFEQNACDYMSNIKVKNKFLKLLELGYYQMLGSFQKTDIKDYQVDKIIEENKYSSFFQNNNGFAMASFKKDDLFFSVFPKPECNNYNSYIKYKDKQIELFKELSNSDFYETLVLLNSRENKSFTEDLLVKKLNVTEKRANEIISKLLIFNLLETQIIEIDDKNVSVFKIDNNPAIIAMLAFTNQIVNKSNTFYFYCVDSTELKYFNLEKKDEV